MSVPIELRVGEDVIPRTIYGDLPSMPDPVKLGLTVRIFNGDSVTLYMRVDGSGTGWTFTSNDLGSIASGGNQYYNLDRFGSKAKPASAQSEQITVRLRAYTDAGYSNLKWTFETVVDIVFIKSDDGSWTTDYNNNFDDGTKQGWAAVLVAGNQLFEDLIASDFFLSNPYSYKITVRNAGSATYASAYQYKSITTPNRNSVFAIINIRNYRHGTVGPFIKNIRVVNATDGSNLVYYGRPEDANDTEYFSATLRWLRIVVPLPKNTTLELRIQFYGYSTQWGTSVRESLWQDDFKVISKD